jgi:hypothetical protein
VFGRLQELNDLAQFSDGLVRAADIFLRAPHFACGDFSRMLLPTPNSPPPDAAVRR